MLNITVTLTADGPLLAVLQNIATALTGGAIAATPAKMTVVQPSASPAVSGSETSSGETGAGNINSTVTLEQVRALVTKKSQAGKMPEIKALLTKFSVAKVTELPADKYDSFYSEVDKIKVA